MLKQVNEQFLLDAISFTEAETRSYEFAEDMVQGEFTVVDIKHKKTIVDVIAEDGGDKFWLVKFKYLSVDGDSDKQKTITNQILVNADTLETANNLIKEYNSQMLVPYEVYAITETKIVEFIPYVKDEEVSE
jgi:hypothetical protein